MSFICRENGQEKYKSNLARFGGTFARYDFKDPVQCVSAFGHGASQLAGADPAIKDVGRMMDGNKSELSAYGSFFGRTIANVREFVSDVLSFKWFSAITKPINMVGDAGADFLDSIGGVSTEREGHRNRLASVFG